MYCVGDIGYHRTSIRLTVQRTLVLIGFCDYQSTAKT